MKTVDLKGKPYVMVNARIMEFWKRFPNGSITTEFVSLIDGVAVMKATISEDGVKVKATGTAYEKEGAGFVNKTSYIENCETSAVGRALGILGIGIDASLASAEEVANAIHQQEKKPTLTPKPPKVDANAKKKAVLLTKICKDFKTISPEQQAELAKIAGKSLKVMTYEELLSFELGISEIQDINIDKKAVDAAAEMFGGNDEK